MQPKMSCDTWWAQQISVYDSKGDNLHSSLATATPTGGDTNDCKSTSGYTFLVTGSTISWGSKKQQTVTLSSTKAEYMALTDACKEAVWLQQLLQDLNVP